MLLIFACRILATAPMGPRRVGAQGLHYRGHGRLAAYDVPVALGDDSRLEQVPQHHVCFTELPIVLARQARHPRADGCAFHGDGYLDLGARRRAQGA